MIDINNKEIQLEFKKELARRDFFSFCNLKAADFYKEDRSYLVELCNEFQDFYESKDDVMVVNVPPRFGKSRTASMFTQWVFGNNKDEKVMTGSYNETLSTVFSKNVRNAIQEEKADRDKIVYNDIFPDTKIQYGDSAMNLWSLEGGYSNYLATSPTGTATGFGASLIIIDDLIKNSQEAYNSLVLEKHWDWFTNTMLSRLEEGGKIIIIMTRWSNNDLAGKALRHFKSEKKKVKHVNMKAVKGDGTMLCKEILSKESYDMKVRAMGEDIASANYNQEPIDIKGKLYSRLKTYTDIPRDDRGNPLFERISNYTDTADTGSDFLCSIVYGVYQKQSYILDVYYTKEPMEITEPYVAKMLFENEVNSADIESNNGGRGFARTIERLLKENHNSNKTKINWFHQSQNKKARILSNSTWVMDNIYFPINWRDKWSQFYSDVTSYQKEGKNKHDDACFVAGTKIATLTGDKNIEDIKIGERVITPFGIRKVTYSGCSGEKEVINNIGLTATSNHKVFSSKRGFVPLDTFTGIAENDIMSLKGMVKWKYKKLLISMESNTNLWGRENIILVSQKQIKEESVLKDFMWQFGSFITKRKFLKAIMFIIKMATLSTMTLLTWSLYTLGNTCPNMQKRILSVKNLVSRIPNNLIELGKRLTSGIEAKRGENGTENTLEKLPTISNHLYQNANNANENTKPSTKALRFAQINVEKNGDGTIEELNIRQFARFATNPSMQQKESRQLQIVKHAPKVVLTSLITKTEKRKVYNLTVDKDHVYYAHGLLVSNCDTLTGIAEMTNSTNKIKILDSRKLF